MSQKKKPNSVPDYIQAAPIMQRRKLTKRRLPSFTEAMTLLHMPELQRKFWKALFEMLDAGDKEGLRSAGEIIGLLEKRGGINVTQQMMAQNVAAGPTSPVMGFDAFARQLAEARAGHALPPPADDVVDVHPVDTAVA